MERTAGIAVRLQRLSTLWLRLEENSERAENGSAPGYRIRTHYGVGRSNRQHTLASRRSYLPQPMWESSARPSGANPPPRRVSEYDVRQARGSATEAAEAGDPSAPTPQRPLLSPDRSPDADKLHHPGPTHQSRPARDGASNKDKIPVVAVSASCSAHVAALTGARSQ